MTPLIWLFWNQIYNKWSTKIAITFIGLPFYSAFSSITNSTSRLLRITSSPFLHSVNDGDEENHEEAAGKTPDHIKSGDGFTLTERSPQFSSAVKEPVKSPHKIIVDRRSSTSGFGVDISFCFHFSDLFVIKFGFDVCAYKYHNDSTIIMTLGLDFWFAYWFFLTENNSFTVFWVFILS